MELDKITFFQKKIKKILFFKKLVACPSVNVSVLCQRNKGKRVKKKRFYKPKREHMLVYCKFTFITCTSLFLRVIRLLTGLFNIQFVSIVHFFYHNLLHDSLIVSPIVSKTMLLRQNHSKCELKRVINLLLWRRQPGINIFLTKNKKKLLQRHFSMLSECADSPLFSQEKKSHQKFETKVSFLLYIVIQFTSNQWKQV